MSKERMCAKSPRSLVFRSQCLVLFKSKFNHFLSITNCKIGF